VHCIGGFHAFLCSVIVGFGGQQSIYRNNFFIVRLSHGPDESVGLFAVTMESTVGIGDLLDSVLTLQFSVVPTFLCNHDVKPVANFYTSYMPA